MDEIKNAFYKIHGQLYYLPEEYCFWKFRNSKGELIRKDTNYYYSGIFNFISNRELRKNLSQLRICLDYQLSVFELLEPKFTFEWQHKLVLCQIVGGIYEGILLDLFEFLGSKNNKDIVSKELVNSALNNKNFGLGSLIDIFQKAKIFNKYWNDYFIDISHLRNTIHPKSLNHPNVGYDKNKIIQSSTKDLTKKLDEFIFFIKKYY